MGPGSHSLRIALAAWLLAVACGPRAPDPRAQRIEETVEVRLPDGFTVTAEVADEPAETAIGLMFRDELAEDRGMVFPYPEEALHSFWMKNCRFPIDIVWLQGTGDVPDRYQVVHVEAGVPPCRSEPCPSYFPSHPASLVLELAAGAAARHRLHLGSRVTVEGVLFPSRPGPHS